ncbi:hypothetical protein [Streptomyces shenzhenensis]
MIDMMLAKDMNAGADLWAPDGTDYWSPLSAAGDPAGLTDSLERKDV